MMAESMLDVQREYGADFNEEMRKRVKESDPLGFELRENIAKQISEEFRNGGNLSREQLRQAEQDARRSQAARGNLYGNAASANELLNTQAMRDKVRQQRLANASSYVFGSPINAQYGNINAAQAGAAPFRTVQFDRGMSLDPNAGARGTDFAARTYDTKSRNWQTQAQIASQRQNPWMQALGVGSQFMSAANPLMGRILSSRKVKKKIRPYEDAYQDLKDLELVRYDYKKGYGPQNEIGLIAEDVPDDLRTKTSDGMNAIDPYKVMIMLTGAVQTLQEEVESLANRRLPRSKSSNL